MQISSWSIASWPRVECYVLERGRILPRLHHASTRCLRDQPGQRAGDTAWVGRIDGAPVGLAWEWFELRPGVIAMEDPNAVITNLRFLDARSESYLEPLAALIAANRLIHATPWQDAVMSVIGGMDYGDGASAYLKAA